MEHTCMFYVEIKGGRKGKEVMDHITITWYNQQTN